MKALVLWAALLFTAPGLLAQGLEYVKAHYTKYEYMIPMRDGKKLFTSVYAPKDRSQPVPILLTRTPYSVAPYGADNYRNNLGPSEAFAHEGYIFAYQDVRGREHSEGEFVDVRPYIPNKKPGDIDETTDAYDTIEWLLKHVKGHNGRVGLYGISYGGFYAAMGAIDAHPALKASSPQAPIGNWFVGDDWHHNGAFFLAHAFNFYPWFAHKKPVEMGTPDGYDYFLRMGPLSAAAPLFKGKISYWEDLMDHGVYDDFWRARNLLPNLRKIRPAMLTVGGWFDAEDLWGALHVYQAIEEQNPGAQNTLVMGPWPHGGWSRSDGEGLGDVRFGSKTSAYFREKIELPFFDFYLKDKGTLKIPEAWVFETGRNEWHEMDAWPPRNAVPRTLFFHAGGKLSFEPPKEAAAFAEYPSDPAKPVPYIGSPQDGMAREYMTADQRFATSRPDVLSFESEVLEEDVTLAGPLRPTLWVSTTGTDADFVVKLIDVYPGDYPDTDPKTGAKMGGYQQLVRGEPIRGKFRNGLDKPEPFVPGQMARIEFTMPDVFHTFRRGHRIMVHVQSSWFPLVDRNPQRFTDIYHAAAAEFQKTTQRLYLSPSQASSLAVQVIK